jgi:rSAM/selenodomain-associated transferase 2
MAASQPLAAGVPSGVSIVVPTWRDDAALSRLLPQLAALQPGADEVLVVDGAGSEATRALATAAGARYLASPAGRGTQLNCGARAARGDVLWFVHADAGVSPAAVGAITRALALGADSGAFRFRFGGERGATQRLLERAIAWRGAVGTVYGDQGLFARRAAFERAGGFAEAPLFEEVPLVRALRRRGGFRVLDEPIVVSPRRWQQDGFWRRTLENRLLALGHAAGLSPARLARWYRRVKDG